MFKQTRIKLQESRPDRENTSKITVNRALFAFATEPTVAAGRGEGYETYLGVLVQF